MHVSVTIGTHLCPSAEAPPPVVYSQETVQWSRSRLHVEAQCSVSSILKLNTTIHTQLHTATHTLVVVVFICTFFVFFKFPLETLRPASCEKSTWLSGGWRKWTLADPSLDPHLRTTTTFISLRLSRTAAGPWSCRAAPPTSTTTGHWPTPAGRCPGTSRRYRLVLFIYFLYSNTWV